MGALDRWNERPVNGRPVDAVVDGSAGASAAAAAAAPRTGRAWSGLLPGRRAYRTATLRELEGRALLGEERPAEAAERFAAGIALLRRPGRRGGRAGGWKHGGHKGGGRKGGGNSGRVGRRNGARLASLLMRSATAHLALGRPAEAVAAMEEAVAVAQRVSVTAYGRQLYNLGVVLRAADRPAPALEAAERAEQVLREPREPPPEDAATRGLLAGALGLQAECHAALGRFERAVELRHRAVRLLEARGGRYATAAARARAWDDLAGELHAAGRWEEADTAYHRGVAVRAVAARREARAGAAARRGRGAPRPRL
ncbi:tetratricopeptide repeat protein [Kitasatospora sp. NPDC054939]